MPQTKKTLIMKFGGASVQGPANFAHIAKLIIEKQKIYDHIVVVVSAMKGMTDHLISLALQVNPEPPKREYDMLVSVGERVSISLLAMALNKYGVKAVSFTGSQSGIVTTSDHSEARIVRVQPGRLVPYLKDKCVVIVAGFQGVSLDKEITTLGRGGSDTSAVALGVALMAEKVEFYKDVVGIFTQDPSKHSCASICSKLTYDEAIQIVEKSEKQVLHIRSLILAKKNKLPLHVLSFLEPGDGTLIFDPKIKSSGVSYEEPLSANSSGF